MFTKRKENAKKVTEALEIRNSVDFKIDYIPLIKETMFVNILTLLFGGFFIGAAIIYSSVLILIIAIIYVLSILFYINFKAIEMQHVSNNFFKYDAKLVMQEKTFEFTSTLLISAVLIIILIYKEIVLVNQYDIYLIVIVPLSYIGLITIINLRFLKISIYNYITKVFGYGILIYLIFSSVHNLFYIMDPSIKLLLTVLFSLCVYCLISIIQKRYFMGFVISDSRGIALGIFILILILAEYGHQTLPNFYKRDSSPTTIGDKINFTETSTITFSVHDEMIVRFENDDYLVLEMTDTNYVGESKTSFNIYNWDFELVKSLSFDSLVTMIEIPEGYAIFTGYIDSNIRTITEYNKDFEKINEINSNFGNTYYVDDLFKYQDSYYIYENRNGLHFKLNGLDMPIEKNETGSTENSVYFQSKNVVFLSFNNTLVRYGDNSVFRGRSYYFLYHDGILMSSYEPYAALTIEDYLKKDTIDFPYTNWNRSTVLSKTPFGVFSTETFTRGKYGSYNIYYKGEIVESYKISDTHFLLSHGSHNYVLTYRLNKYGNITGFNIGKMDSYDISEKVFIKQISLAKYNGNNNICNTSSNVGSLCKITDNIPAKYISSISMLIVLSIANIPAFVSFKRK